MLASTDMGKARLNARTSREIDENLKRVFQEHLEEEIPDRLKKLLDQLRRQDSDPTGRR